MSTEITGFRIRAAEPEDALALSALIGIALGRPMGRYFAHRAHRAC